MKMAVCKNQLEAISTFSCDNLLPYNAFLSNHTQYYFHYHLEHLKVCWYFLADYSPFFPQKYYFLEYFFENIKEGVFINIGHQPPLPRQHFANDTAFGATGVDWNTGWASSPKNVET